ncbi:MAG: pyridoxamine 5'-phosphate oxidase family protein [Thermodesulfovibrionales bacterium]|nr:pyridoxamine 5'-phosphate oxidase family protein [Thermodesulfovibrionales bacterium]
MSKEFTQKELENFVIEFMKARATCVIATCSDTMPRASTVEFFPSGLTVYILTEGGRKLENIRKNPQVSIAVSDAFTNWESLRGLQITGAAEIGTKGSDIFNGGLEAYRKRRGKQDAALPDFMSVIKVIPIQIEYIDTRLAKRGYPIRNILSLM